jgi:hypothetical protein
MSSSVGVVGVVPRTEENAPDMIRIPEHRLAVIRTKQHSTLNQKDDPGTTNVVEHGTSPPEMIAPLARNINLWRLPTRYTLGLYDFFIPSADSFMPF